MVGDRCGVKGQGKEVGERNLKLCRKVRRTEKVSAQRTMLHDYHFHLFRYSCFFVFQEKKKRSYLRTSAQTAG